MKNLHQNIKCKLCNSNNTYFFIESSDYRLKTSNNFFKLYKCLDCDFIFQNQKSLSAYKYEGNFFTKLDIISFFNHKIWEFRIKNIIKKNFNKNIKVLDYGCGSGAFVKF